jgi:hypothetical protein
MNNRIKELALAAFQPINDIASEGVADRRTFDQAWFQLYNEKFAELIVKECAEICMKKYDTGLMMAPQSPWIAKQILEHFGVEE